MNDLFQRLATVKILWHMRIAYGVWILQFKRNKSESEREMAMARKN